MKIDIEAIVKTRKLFKYKKVKNETNQLVKQTIKYIYNNLFCKLEMKECVPYICTLAIPIKRELIFRLRQDIRCIKGDSTKGSLGIAKKDHSGSL